MIIIKLVESEEIDIALLELVESEEHITWCEVFAISNVFGNSISKSYLNDVICGVNRISSRQI